MQFIYSTLEFYILPIVNIAIDIREKYPSWKFGKFVIESIEDCKTKYYKKTFDDLDVDNLTDEQILIINALKDYGMTSIIKRMNIEMLEEINNHLSIRYSTIDIIKAIEKLSITSELNKNFYKEIIDKYLA